MVKCSVPRIAIASLVTSIMTCGICIFHWIIQRMWASNKGGAGTLANLLVGNLLAAGTARYTEFSELSRSAP